MERFADPHIHGGWGYSFQKAQFAPLEEKLRSLKIVFAIPTLMNDSLENLGRIGEVFFKYREKNPDSIFPFLRVEGPFINPEKAGAQDRRFILSPTEEKIKEFLSLPAVKMFTFAPEVKGTEALVKSALDMGKIPSIGHSNATFRDVLKVYKMGVRHFTHFPNALSGLHHREVGAMGAGLFLEGIHLEVIGDFIHTSPDFIRLLLKVRGPSFSLISDMVPQGPSLKPIKNRRGILLGGGAPVPEQKKNMEGLGLEEEDLERICLLNALAFFNPEKPDIP